MSWPQRREPAGLYGTTPEQRKAMKEAKKRDIFARIAQGVDIPKNKWGTFIATISTDFSHAEVGEILSAMSRAQQKELSEWYKKKKPAYTPGLAKVIEDILEVEDMLDVLYDGDTPRPIDPLPSVPLIVAPPPAASVPQDDGLDHKHSLPESKEPGDEKVPERVDDIVRPTVEEQIVAEHEAIQEEEKKEMQAIEDQIEEEVPASPRSPEQQPLEPPLGDEEEMPPQEGTSNDEQEIVPESPLGQQEYDFDQDDGDEEIPASPGPPMEPITRPRVPIPIEAYQVKNDFLRRFRSLVPVPISLSDVDAMGGAGEADPIVDDSYTEAIALGDALCAEQINLLRQIRSFQPDGSLGFGPSARQHQSGGDAYGSDLAVHQNRVVQAITNSVAAELQNSQADVPLERTEDYEDEAKAEIVEEDQKAPVDKEAKSYEEEIAHLSSQLPSIPTRAPSWSQPGPMGSQPISEEGEQDEIDPRAFDVNFGNFVEPVSNEVVGEELPSIFTFVRQTPTLKDVKNNWFPIGDAKRDFSVVVDLFNMSRTNPLVLPTSYDLLQDFLDYYSESPKTDAQLDLYLAVLSVVEQRKLKLIGNSDDRKDAQAQAVEHLQSIEAQNTTDTKVSFNALAANVQNANQDREAQRSGQEELPIEAEEREVISAEQTLQRAMIPVTAKPRQRRNPGPGIAPLVDPAAVAAAAREASFVARPGALRVSMPQGSSGKSLKRRRGPGALIQDPDPLPSAQEQQVVESRPKGRGRKTRPKGKERKTRPKFV